MDFTWTLYAYTDECDYTTIDSGWVSNAGDAVEALLQLEHLDYMVNDTVLKYDSVKVVLHLEQEGVSESIKITLACKDFDRRKDFTESITNAVVIDSVRNKYNFTDDICSNDDFNTGDSVNNYFMEYRDVLIDQVRDSYYSTSSENDIEDYEDTQNSNSLPSVATILAEYGLPTDIDSAVESLLPSIIIDETSYRTNIINAANLVLNN